ncbi:MAG TPA: sialate O-acetylesterase [Clostridiales bacterium]|nr:sialate O-acetylesterase [Clostridiales bacterium]
MKSITKKKIIYCAIVVVLVAATVTFAALWAQAAKPPRERTFYEKKCEAFALQNKNVSKGQIVFIGDSLTDRYALDASYADLPLASYNRGIGGDKTSGLLARLEDSLLVLEPTKISLLIGINDINGGVPDQTILNNYKEILDRIQERLPAAEVFCTSILPMHPTAFRKREDYDRSMQRIPVINEGIRSLAASHGYQYLDLYPLFEGEDHYLIESYSTDGLHLSAEGYAVWTAALKPYLS